MDNDYCWEHDLPAKYCMDYVHVLYGADSMLSMLEKMEKEKTEDHK